MRDWRFHERRNIRETTITRIFTHYKHTAVASTASTYSSSSLATINHYHHHYRDRRHRRGRDLDWFARHPRAGKYRTGRDLLILPGRKLLLKQPPSGSPPPFACISSFSSSSSSTHPAICVPHLSRILDARSTVPSIPWNIFAHSDLSYYSGAEITRWFFLRILFWLNRSVYLRQDRTSPGNIRLLQSWLNKQILIR